MRNYIKPTGSRDLAEFIHFDGELPPEQCRTARHAIFRAGLATPTEVRRIGEDPDVYTARQIAERGLAAHRERAERIAHGWRSTANQLDAQTRHWIHEAAKFLPTVTP